MRNVLHALGLQPIPLNLLVFAFVGSIFYLVLLDEKASLLYRLKPAQGAVSFGVERPHESSRHECAVVCDGVPLAVVKQPGKRKQPSSRAPSLAF